jgi:antitoxin ParD1/3/4
MGKLERVTVDLPEELVAAVRAAVSSGEYATPSEVVSEALRDWKGEQGPPSSGIPTPRSREDLMAMIEEGENGPFLDGPSVLAEFRAKYRHKPE